MILCQRSRPIHHGSGFTALLTGFVSSFVVRLAPATPVSAANARVIVESCTSETSNDSCISAFGKSATGAQLMQSSFDAIHEWGGARTLNEEAGERSMRTNWFENDLAVASAGPTPSPAPPPEMMLLASAPQPHLVRAEVEKKKELDELLAKGDLHFTQHGCHCLLDWEHEGEKQEGCSKSEPEFAKGHHWCKVNTPCAKEQGFLEVNGEQQKWDFCSLPGELSHEQTIHGCHCAPHWEFDDKEYSGCSRTSLGPMWCYIFETDNMCKEALRTEHGGQHWDYCFVEEQASPYLTKHGCHCMPEWSHDGVRHMGCAKLALKEGDEPTPWCITLEDAHECPMGNLQKEGESVLVEDACSLEQGTEEKILETLTLAGDTNCHCQPVWEHNGVEYTHCARTPDSKQKWCYLLEDERACPEADGKGEGKEKTQRWRYCEVLPGENKTDAAEESKEEGMEQALYVGDTVRVLVAVKSANNVTDQLVPVGTIGNVSEVDSAGDALVDFRGQGRHWVFQNQFFKLQRNPVTGNESDAIGKDEGDVSNSAEDNDAEVFVSSPFKFEIPYSKDWKVAMAKEMSKNMEAMGVAEQDLDYNRVNLVDRLGNDVKIGDTVTKGMFPLLVRYDTQPAFRFKVKYSVDWEEALAKSTEEAMDTLGMTEEELDPTRVAMTSAQGETLSFGQQVKKSQFPISVAYSHPAEMTTTPLPESNAPQTSAPVALLYVSAAFVAAVM